MPAPPTTVVTPASCSLVNFRVSAPRPALMLSAPPPPVMVSSPPPPLMVSALLVPMKVSAPSKLVAEMFRAAVPPVKALASIEMLLVNGELVLLSTSTTPSLPLKLSPRVSVKLALVLSRMRSTPVTVPVLKS